MKIRKNLIIFTILTVSVLCWPFQAGAVVQWTKSGSNPVLSRATSGSWDDYAVELPAVIKDGSTYKMWYTGTDDIHSNEIPQTGYAYSSDGIAWTRGNSGNPVLSPGSSGEWDDRCAAAVGVVKEESTYKMWYSGSDDNVGEIDTVQIGYATSTDGINWTKYDDPSTPDAPYAESDPVLTMGTAGTDWDGDEIWDPTVIIDNNAPASQKYKMWYVGEDDTLGTAGIGYAYSSDGINWTKYNNPGTGVPYANSDPVIWPGPQGAWNEDYVFSPTVIKEDSVYRMWLAGEDDHGVEKIGYYTSINGIHWTQYKGNPVIMQGDTASDDFDENGAFDPMVIKDGATYKMWYAGEKDCDPCLTQIGYATAPAYPGAYLAINKMMVSTFNTDNTPGGMNTIVFFVPEGPGPLDFNELKVDGPGGFSHTFTNSELWNHQGNQVPFFKTSGMPAAGTYTFTAKSNNGLTASNSLNFTSPTTIPVYGTGSGAGELDMQIKVGGSFYFNQSYIGTTTPTFRFKPAGGTDKYYRVMVFDFKNKWTVWLSELIPGTDAVGGYIDIAVPANVFVPDAPYRWRVEIFDTSDKWTAHNRSVNNIQNFYTGTKDTSVTPDFIDWTAFRSQRSFLNGDQTHFGFKVINLAPWDIDTSGGKFSVLNEGGAGTFFNFNPYNNAQSGITTFYYWGVVGGIAADATSTGYEFVATENTTPYFESVNRPYQDVSTLPMVTREDMLLDDNAYLANTTPTLSWVSKGTGYKYRVAIFTWSRTEILFSSFQVGLPAGQTMSETIPQGTLREYNPYSWCVEVFDTNEYSRTRSSWLTFLTGGEASSDFNEDGYTDILWRHNITGKDVIWLMDGTSLDSYAWLDTVDDPNWMIIEIADFDMDGDPDILWRNNSTGQNVIWVMDGTALDSYAWLDTVADTNWEIIEIADFDTDGDPDILWRHSTTGQNVIWVMDGTSLDSYAWLDTVADTSWEIAAVADFNCDGYPEILWRHSTTGQNVIWVMNGTSLDSYAWLDTVSDTCWEIADVADFNGDCYTDILWRNACTGQIVIWVMNNASLSSYAWLPTVADTNWKIIKAADFDTDNDPDILWRHSATGQNVIWVMDGTALDSYAWLDTVADTDWEIQ